MSIYNNFYKTFIVFLITISIINIYISPSSSPTIINRRNQAVSVPKYNVGFISIGAYRDVSREIVLGYGNVKPSECICGNKISKAKPQIIGTFFENNISPTSGKIRFLGNKVLTVECPICGNDKISLSEGDNEVDIFKDFNSINFKERSIICTSVVYGVTGTQWLIEWIQYNLVIGFGHIVVYTWKLPKETMEVLNFYKSLGKITIHDWSFIPTSPKKFKVDNWEHGQLLARNDCYQRYKHNTEYIGFIDIDELFDFNKSIDETLDYFDELNLENENKIGFAINSVTTPPIVSHKQFPDDSLILQRFEYTEKKCQAPYNCGIYHYGRQKYFLKVNSNKKPNVPLFYHAISMNYEYADPMMRLIDPSLIYIRHYAGHFKHSRIGGLKYNNKIYRPIKSTIINEIKNMDPWLYHLYVKSPREKFLKLYDIDNNWRFSKPSDKLKYMSFELFSGRLNNQLITYDWAFRISKALGRILIIKTKNFKQIEHDIRISSLWNTSLLSQHFDFVTDVEIPNQLNDECVWDDNKDKFIVNWAVTIDGKCDHIHFKSHRGLIHPYRSFTVDIGVGMLDFWRAFRPIDRILNKVNGFFNSIGGDIITGIHSRSHNSYGEGNAAKAKRSCERLIMKPQKHILNICPQKRKEIVSFYENEHLLDFCNFTEKSIKWHVNRNNISKIFLASDHENRRSDNIFKNKYNAVEYTGHERGIEAVIIDMFLLYKTDFFMGNIGSTLSQNVCFFRLSDNIKELSNICKIILDTINIKCRI